MTKGKIQGKNTSTATIFTKQEFISALKKVCRKVEVKKGELNK
jgi:hypothetical protein